MEKLVSFISCVNNEELYSKCLLHIEQLEMPAGYTYDTIAIRGAKSLTSGYNQAMKQSKAKYKIYLHQDTFIINKNFIFDIIQLFAQHKEIGLMGVVGAEKLRASCGWGNSRHKYGKVIENSSGGALELLEFDKVHHIKEVQCVDGLIIITQYDLPWRQDIFDGWHYYDLSQSLEFIRAGYLVCIPEQENPWCIHDCGEVNLDKFDKYRYLFVKEYCHDLFKIGYLPVLLHNKIHDTTRPYIKRIEGSIKKILKCVRA